MCHLKPKTGGFSYANIKSFLFGCLYSNLKNDENALNKNGKYWDSNLFLLSFLFLIYCQPQAKAKAKAMPGRLYIHTGIIIITTLCHI